MPSEMSTGAPRADSLVGFRRRWTVATAVGELVGFIPPAVTGATLAALGASDPVLVIGLTLAGMAEGAVLGVAQAKVLSGYRPAVDDRAWVRATALAAGLAWFVGMGGGAVMGTDPPPLVLVLLVPAWAAGLLAMGYAQWRVLRPTIPRSGRWVGVTAGAWLVGVMIPVAVLSAAPNAWPGWAHAVAGVLAAVAMGVTVGALTAPTMARLLSSVAARPAQAHRGEGAHVTHRAG